MSAICKGCGQEQQHGGHTKRKRRLVKYNNMTKVQALKGQALRIQQLFNYGALCTQCPQLCGAQRPLTERAIQWPQKCFQKTCPRTCPRPPAPPILLGKSTQSDGKG
eukprot:3393410-Amphidinium_carterae.2